jgi:hypothetical protein
VTRGAPADGEHNRAIFVDGLDVSEDELSALIASGVV